MYFFPVIPFSIFPCVGLDNCWGEEFETLYESYVSKGKARRTFKARELWYAILDAQIETGEWNQYCKGNINCYCCFFIQSLPPRL